MALTLSVGAFLMTTACSTKAEPAPKVKPQTYTTYGRYYTNIYIEGVGIVEGIETTDGNVWGYETDTISDKPVYDSMPVWIGFSDNGTPDDITDDVILGLVYDRNTAIYDQLETELSEGFELERNGNEIRIQTLKRSDD